MDMEGHSKATEALLDAKLSASKPMATMEVSEYVSASESQLSLSSAEVGFASASSWEPSPANFVSSRIERLMQSKNEYSSAVEFEVEASKDHWSELDPMTDEEENIETDLEIFQSLRKKWGGFFRDYGDRLVIGEKIAEGGQAEIFNADLTSYDGIEKQECVLKVFKEGWALRDLQKQWPLGMLQQTLNGGGTYLTDYSCLIYNGSLLQNGRFAFRMDKYWGDLRKLIDFRMQHNGNQSPPFTHEEEMCIILAIAEGMQKLHGFNIIHRDLKASNVLVYDGTNNGTFDPTCGNYICDMADFECSVGIVGTGYWRAPEILRAVQNCNIKSYLFTERSDVYSFAMTCYEVLTGCIPFEDLGGTCYDIVIDGRRPQLPNDTSPLLKTLLNRCWHSNLLERPLFQDIVERLKEIYLD